MTTEVIVAETPPASTVISPEGGTEPIAEAAVEIAKIEARKEIKLAEISAETTVLQTEAVTRASAEYNAQAEVEQCRWEIAELRAGQAATQEALALILTKLTPAELPPPNPLPASVEVTPANPEVAEPTPEPPKPKKRHKWI